MSSSPKASRNSGWSRKRSPPLGSAGRTPASGNLPGAWEEDPSTGRDTREKWNCCLLRERMRRRVDRLRRDVPHAGTLLHVHTSETGAAPRSRPNASLPRGFRESPSISEREGHALSVLGKFYSSALSYWSVVDHSVDFCCAARGSVTRTFFFTLLPVSLSQTLNTAPGLRGSPCSSPTLFIVVCTC